MDEANLLYMWDEEGHMEFVFFPTRAEAEEAARRAILSHPLFDEIKPELSTWQDWNEAVEAHTGMRPMYRVEVETLEPPQEDLFYERRIMQLRDRYAERALAWLGQLDLSEPHDPQGDDIRWKTQGDAFDISFRLNEQRAYEGGGDGINFSAHLDRLDGVVGPSISPYNYTERCWVDLWDDEAIEARFQMVENTHPEELIHAYS